MANFTPTSPDFVNVLRDAVEEALKHYIESEFERAKNDFIADFDRKKDEIVASIAVNLIKTVDFKMMGNTLTLSVLTDKIKTHD